MAIVSDPQVEMTPAGPVITIHATSVSTGDQITIPVDLTGGTIVRRDYYLVSGTGTTIDYATYNVAGSSSLMDWIEEWTSAASAQLTDSTKVPFFCPDGNLYTTLTLDAGTDNVVLIRLYLSARFV